jgi:phosphohistidine phosphatase
MDLILWRHADAISSAENDHQRKLTGRGRKQAATMAAWLDRRLPDGAKIITSPAIRAIETADALSSKYNRKVSVKETLNVGASATQYLIAAGWPDNRHPVVIVGHQPALGQLAAFLLYGEEQNLTFRKAAVWWLTNRSREEVGESESAYPVVLRAAICPDLI